jgi:hypothetical protein
MIYRAAHGVPCNKTKEKENEEIGYIRIRSCCSCLRKRSYR